VIRVNNKRLQRKNSFIPLFLATGIFLVSAILLFGSKRQSIALLILNDVSSSAVSDSDFQKAVLKVCKEIKGKLDESDESNLNLFALVKYADYAENSGQWEQLKSLNEKDCSNSSFSPEKNGTDPQQAITIGQKLLGKLNPDQEAVRPIVIVFAHADERISESMYDREEMIESLKSLNDSIQTRGGSLIIISGPHDGLRRDLVNGLKDEDIRYCNPKDLQGCQLSSVAQKTINSLKWYYPFLKP
jgi:hypothetical protein